MHYYLEEVNRIKRICRSKQRPIDLVMTTHQYIDHHFDTNLNPEQLNPE
ncbi:MAG: hypothetical protein MI921_00470 [Cytophagales bacterium]|nr:hypothetical protein [Cytophagales bacterium]